MKIQKSFKLLVIFAVSFINLNAANFLTSYECAYEVKDEIPITVNQIYNPQDGNNDGYLELYVNNGSINLTGWKLCYATSNKSECIDLGLGNGDVYFYGSKIATDSSIVATHSFIIYPETLFELNTGNNKNSFGQSNGEVILLDNNDKAVHYVTYYNNNIKAQYEAEQQCTTTYPDSSANDSGICATPDGVVNTSNIQDDWDKNCADTKGTYNDGLKTCFADDFNRATMGSVWSIIKSERYIPKIVDNKFMLTDNGSNRAVGVSISGDFPSQNNLVELDFEHNAYGGSGADGVTVVLSDANISPIAGAYGGSLGYAQRNGVEGFAGAWLGFGLDEYGNFANDREGRGSGCSVHPPSSIILDSLTIRGRVTTDRTKGYCFISNSGNLNMSTGVGIDDRFSNTPAPGNKYKFIIDTRNNQTIITVLRSSDGVNYTLLPNMTEVNATQSAQAPDSFKLSITGSTGGSNNYHSFDDIDIKASACGTLGSPPKPEDAKFDAWDDYGSHDQSNRLISTKVVNQPFALTIGSMNEDFSGIQEYSGTVCAQITDSTGNPISDLVKLLFADELSKSTTFTINRAINEAHVSLAWKADENVADCSSMLEDNRTVASDYFAVRPDKYEITLPAGAYAGEVFNLDVKALDINSNNANDYNATKDISFEIISNITKSGCANGTLGIENFSFENGFKSVDVNYSDIGDLNITIREKTNSEFAIIDKDDTLDSERLISQFSKIITIQPYELNVSNVEYNNTIGGNWLYMADVGSISQNVKSTIVANDKQHNKVQNFTDSCYAQNVHVKTNFAVINPNSNVEIKYNDSSVESIDDINKTVIIPKASFVNSQADLDYDFNIQRDYKILYNPVQIALKEVNIISNNIAKVENNASVDLNTVFYYGRVKTEDISTNEKSVKHNIDIEVYSTSRLPVFNQNSLNWYQSNSDNYTDGIVFREKENFNFANDKSGMSLDNIQVISNGTINFDLVNTWSVSDSSMIHLDIPVWLWYSRYNDYNSLGDCSTHPCFEYRYIKLDVGGILKSGDYKGSTIDRDYNSSKQKIGVKTFR